MKSARKSGENASARRAAVAGDDQELLRKQLVEVLTRMAIVLAPTDPARNRSFEPGGDGVEIIELAIRGLCAAVGMNVLVLTLSDVELVARLTARLEVHHRAAEGSVH